MSFLIHFNMEYDFNTVLDALLKLAEEHPELSPDELIKMKAEEWNLDEKLQSEISESEEILTDFDEKVKELHAQGKGREYFIEKELSRITEGRSETEKKAVSEAIQSVLGQDVELENQE